MTELIASGWCYLSDISQVSTYNNAYSYTALLAARRKGGANGGAGGRCCDGGRSPASCSGLPVNARNNIRQQPLTNRPGVFILQTRDKNQFLIPNSEG